MSETSGSPFFNDMSPADRERFVLHARETYEFMKEMRSKSFQGHVDYGKWLIASMLAVHGGSIYVLNALKTGADIELQKALVHAGICSAAGIALIMLAGFGAWLNFQFLVHTYDDAATPAMLYRSDEWPDFSANRSVNITFWASAIVGVASWLCFIAAAVLVFRAL